MALPDTYVKATTRTTVAGIVLSIVPADPNFDINLYRTTDSGGVPNAGAEELVGTWPPFPASGDYIFDALPVTGTIYYYRIAHSRPNWTTGAKSPWSRPAVASALAVRPDSRLPIATVPDAGVSDESIGADGVIVYGPDGRQDLVFNGDAERGRAYWQSFSRSGNPTPGTSIANVPAMSFIIDDTAGRYAGTGSFKATAALASDGFRIIQTTRIGDVDAPSASPVLIKIVEGSEMWRVRMVAKSSVNGTTLDLIVSLWGDALNNTGTYGIAEFTLTTSWAAYDFIGGAGWTAATPPNKYASIEVVCTATDGRTVTWDLLRVERATQSADIVVPLTLTAA